MSVHRISLAGALLIILVAIVFLFLVGPFGLLILILAAVLLWYAFGPGARAVAGS
jgi:energy-coupling factor transporter transmembrane protein EcfT